VGLIQPGQVLNDQDAANLIFLPVFYRYLKYGAVGPWYLHGGGSEVNALGGRIETTTEAGQVRT
jgi:hypothetical protein